MQTVGVKSKAGKSLGSKSRDKMRKWRANRRPLYVCVSPFTHSLYSEVRALHLAIARARGQRGRRAGDVDSLMRRALAGVRTELEAEAKALGLDARAIRAEARARAGKGAGRKGKGETGTHADARTREEGEREQEGEGEKRRLPDFLREAKHDHRPRVDGFGSKG